MEIVLIAYAALINLLAIIVTASDKYTAAHLRHGRRVPEKTLLIIALLGGSISMLITMLIIRHKTKKPKFMLGIPIIILLQAAAVFALIKTGVII